MPTSFSYDPRSRRYRNLTSGRFITAREVRAVVDGVIESYQAGVLALAVQLQAGGLTLAQWQVQTEASLKALHVAVGAAANGGFDHMSQADWGYVGSLVKRQYRYLEGLAVDVASGRQLIGGAGFISRVRLYAQAARGSYEQMVTRAARIGGVTEARRVLGPADHCPGCVAEANRGWVPIEAVAPIGSQECLANCHCYIEFQTTAGSKDG